MDADALLRQVHKRIGKYGTAVIYTDALEVIVDWKRDYQEDGLSDRRTVSGNTLSVALEKVLRWEDDADAADAAERDALHRGKA
jgi:hypothetical protein